MSRRKKRSKKRNRKSGQKQSAGVDKPSPEQDSSPSEVRADASKQATADKSPEIRRPKKRVWLLVAAILLQMTWFGCLIYMGLSE